MKKILIAYYSRTGTTRKVAERIKEKTNGDIEEIISVKNRAGAIGYFLSGREATLKKPAEIKPTIKNPANYDLVVLGTPVWVWNISSPARGYLERNKGRIKSVAAFCTMGARATGKHFRK